MIGANGKPIDMSKGDAVVISGFFRSGSTGLKDFTAEYKLLTEQDKKQLAGGIRDESLTY